jgi:group II intron reverse transcriptase/maturase
MLDRITSREALYSAFERVRDRAGCRGVDGITVADFAADLENQLDRLQRSLYRRRYHPLPLLRLAVPKREGGVRHLAVPAVRGRVLQTAVYLATQNLFEAEFEAVSHAFRPGRSVRSAVHQIGELRDQGFRYVVDADIEGFFDNIPRDRLLARLRRMGLHPYVFELFALWIDAEIYDGERLDRPAKGIPQGAVVSPMLANLFLDELDESLALLGQTVVRYCDDFLVLCKTPEAQREALEITDYLVGQLELVLHPEKTRTTTFEEGFRFLGAIFVKDSVFLPFDRVKAEPGEPRFPPPFAGERSVFRRSRGRHVYVRRREA